MPLLGAEPLLGPLAPNHNNKRKYRQHRESIPISHLPATFREAVQIARVLDVCYLWIDYLCIIQDDFLDWEHEASGMGNVYAHAYFIISALSSADDSSGCFGNGSDVKTVSIHNLHISCDSWATGFPAIPLVAALIIDMNSDDVDMQQFRKFFMREDLKSRVYVSCEWMPPSEKDNPRDYLVFDLAARSIPLSMNRSTSGLGHCRSACSHHELFSMTHRRCIGSVNTVCSVKAAP